jgi:hypothetical protein
MDTGCSFPGVRRPGRDIKRLLHLHAFVAWMWKSLALISHSLLTACEVIIIIIIIIIRGLVKLLADIFLEGLGNATKNLNQDRLSYPVFEPITYRVQNQNVTLIHGLG